MSKLDNSNLNNGSKKLIINDYISNTQREKRNKRRRIIKNSKLTLTSENLINSYVDINRNNLHRIYDLNKINYNNKNEKISNLIVPKKISYLPFDLNNIFIADSKEIIKKIINKELESKKIKYEIKNNKYLCWKNDNKFFFEIKQINENNNCYVINIGLTKQKNNDFNISFFKEFFKNINN